MFKSWHLPAAPVLDKVPTFPLLVGGCLRFENQLPSIPAAVGFKPSPSVALFLCPRAGEAALLQPGDDPPHLPTAGCTRGWCALVTGSPSLWPSSMCLFFPCVQAHTQASVLPGHDLLCAPLKTRCVWDEAPALPAAVRVPPLRGALAQRQSPCQGPRFPPRGRGADFL